MGGWGEEAVPGEQASDTVPIEISHVQSLSEDSAAPSSLPCRPPGRIAPSPPLPFLSHPFPRSFQGPLCAPQG